MGAKNAAMAADSLPRLLALSFGLQRLNWAQIEALSELYHGQAKAVKKGQNEGRSHDSLAHLTAAFQRP